jgi:signal transduction histidine kinase
MFAVTVTFTMAFAFFLTGFIAYWSFRTSMPADAPPQAWLPFVSFAIAAVIVSISLTLLISRRFFVPIEQLISALKQVASGDFKVQLPETAHDSKIDDMNINFNKMVKELNSMETLQADFIQNVSHEIRTPLSAIEGYAKLLNSENLTEEGREYTLRIFEAAKRLSYLTGNILKLSKLENQQIISEKHIFSLDEQLRQTILLLEPVWGKKDLEINIDLPEANFFGNEELLFQVWTNLISNAVKFTPRGGNISVLLEKNLYQISVIVQDSGIGMTEDVKARIFDRFYQGDKNRNVEGNGLGLALVKKIIDLCEGKIEVVSRPDFGSVFTVRLPNSNSL